MVKVAELSADLVLAGQSLTVIWNANRFLVRDELPRGVNHDKGAPMVVLPSLLRVLLCPGPDLGALY